MDENKKTRRSKEELLSEIDKKIVYHREQMTKLEEKKERMSNPPPRKKTISSKKIIDWAKANGFSIEEIAEKLNIDIKNIWIPILKYFFNRRYKCHVFISPIFYVIKLYK